jgi:signal transduction histidine kinase
VKSNAERLLALINDLLDISRIEAGRIGLHRTALDLARVVRGVVSSFRPLIDTKGQALTVEVGDALPAVWGDQDRVTQILTNLVSNAHKYTPAGGRITIAAQPENEFVRVDIRDTGIGLSPEEQTQLFTKFFRGRNRASEGVGGTGLGLVITRALVELHGGRMTVSSAPGRGSTFSFTLPGTTATPDVAAADAPAVLAPGGTRVLVVDDEPDIANLLRHYLERAGLNVLLARMVMRRFAWRRPSVRT